VHFLEFDIKMPIYPGRWASSFPQMTKSVIMTSRIWWQNMSDHSLMIPINIYSGTIIYGGRSGKGYGKASRAEAIRRLPMQF
jgi:hypothetical protein